MMKNKVSVILISIILLNSNISLATHDIKIVESKYKLNQYVESEWDLLGHRGETLYFELRNDYAKGNVLKEVEFDYIMRKETYSMGGKILDDNAIIYGSLAALYGVKTSRVVVNKKAKETVLKRIVERAIKF